MCDLLVIIICYSVLNSGAILSDLCLEEVSTRQKAKFIKL